MAPDHRLVEDRGLELAELLCQEAIGYLQQQLGVPMPRRGRRLADQVRLLRLYWRLKHLERVIGALRSPEPTPPAA